MPATPVKTTPLGYVSMVVLPVPSAWPDASPQQCKFPELVTAQVYMSPQEIALTPVRLLMAAEGGDFIKITWPLPNAPLVPLPQQLTTPPVRMTQTCSRPVDKAITPVSTLTEGGDDVETSDPIPSCPPELLPQQRTPVHVNTTTHVNDWPQETSRTSVRTTADGGVSKLEVPPVPSCPSDPNPQHRTPLDERLTLQVW